MNSQDRQFGTVATWIVGPAFGFVQPDDGGADLFVHITALGGLDRLRVGQRVSFEPDVDRRTGKSRAINVELMDE